MIQKTCVKAYGCKIKETIQTKRRKINHEKRTKLEKHNILKETVFMIPGIVHNFCLQTLCKPERQIHGILIGAEKFASL